MGKYFNGLANKMVKGIGLALVVEVGQLAGQRWPWLRKILRAETNELSQKQLKQKAWTWVGENLAEKEVLVFDAGAHKARATVSFSQTLCFALSLQLYRSS